MEETEAVVENSSVVEEEKYILSDDTMKNPVVPEMKNTMKEKVKLLEMKEQSSTSSDSKANDLEGDKDREIEMHEDQEYTVNAEKFNKSETTSTDDILKDQKLDSLCKINKSPVKFDKDIFSSSGETPLDKVEDSGTCEEASTILNGNVVEQEDENISEQILTTKGEEKTEKKYPGLFNKAYERNVTNHFSLT